MHWWEFHRTTPNSPHSRAERGALIAFGIAAGAIGFLHVVSKVISTLGPDAPNPLGWPTMLTSLPAMPIYMLAISPWEIPEPFDFLCSMVIAAVVWGALAAMPTYIFISRSDDAARISN